MAKYWTQIKDHLQRFFYWWFGELAACVPARLRDLFSSGGQKLWVSIQGSTVIFEHAKGRGVQWLGNLDLSQTSPGGQRETAREIIEGAKLRSASVVVRLARESVLRRIVELPAPTLENLREVLTFEMDRHTPFDANEVYFDYRLAKHNQQTKRISVDLVVVSRDIAERAIALVQAWGLHTDRLSLIEENGEDSGFNLLASTAGERRRRPVLRVNKAIIGATVAALLVAVYLPLQDKQALLSNQEDKLRQVRAQAAEADKLKEQVKNLSDRSRFVILQKQTRTTVTELMDEVTRLMPDDTWLLQFSQRGERLSVSGYSEKPSALISLLEESDMLNEVSFSSPVTADPRVGRERFNISARVAPRPAP